MAKEFEGSATGGSFSVNKTLRTGDNSKENEQRFASTLADYGRVQAQNDQTHIRNAEKNTKGWQDLAKFSKQLTNKLVKDQQAKNLEDYEAGVADAYMNGIPKDEADAFDEQEKAVYAVGEETDKLGAEYTELSGSRAQGERISASSGWRALGRATGLAQQGAAAYPMFLAKNSAMLAEATDPETYADTLGQLRTEYLQQFGGLNRAMMAKYMFPKMQELEAKQFMSWQTNNNELLEKERIAEMGSTFYARVSNGQGGEAAVQFLQQNRHALGGWAGARDKLFKLIDEGIANGDISGADLEALKDQPYNFNGKQTTLGRQFARDFKNTEQLIQNRRVQVATNTDNDRKIRKKEIETSLYEYMESQGRTLTDDEKSRMLAEWPRELGSPDTLNDIITVEDYEDKAVKERLIDRIESGGVVTEEDIKGLPLEDQKYFRDNYVGKTGANSALKSVDSWLQSRINKARKETDGDTAKTTLWQDQYDNAKTLFKQQYLKNLQSMSADDAIKETKRWIDANIDSIPTEIVSSNNAEKDKKNLATAGDALKTDPNVWQTQTIPGTEDSLKRLQEMQKKPGVPTVPQIYHTLASHLKGVSGFDLANQQLELNGLPPLIKGEGDEYIDGITDQEIKEMFTYHPTPSRVMRAGNVIEYLTGDRSHGGYREDHGGSNYHEHIAFDSPETTQAAIDLLESNNIFVGSRNDGKHADTSYHYVDQAFDVPLYPNLERFGLPDNQQGEEQFSAMVRDLLGKNGFGGAGIRASKTQPVSATSKQFLDFIAGPESSGDYEAFNTGGSNGGHTAHGSGYGADASNKYGKPLTQMTVGEVIALGNTGRIHAAGRYQIINQTLKGLVRNHKIDTNALYDEEMQDQLALKLAYARLVRGNKITGLRNEWVSLQNISAGEIRDSLGAGFNNPELLLKGVR